MLQSGSVKLREKVFVAAILLLPLLIISYDVFSEGIDTEPKNASENNSHYTLKIKKDFISLNARDASLKKILEDIGKRMEIDVVTDITAEEKVTLEFDNLSLEEAIKRLSTNYVYLMDSEEVKGKITKIVVLPKGKGKAFKAGSSQSASEEHAKKEKSKAGSFKFQFDPSQYMKEEK